MPPAAAAGAGTAAGVGAGTAAGAAGTGAAMMPAGMGMAAAPAALSAPAIAPSSMAGIGGMPAGMGMAPGAAPIAAPSMAPGSVAAGLEELPAAAPASGPMDALKDLLSKGGGPKGWMDTANQGMQFMNSFQDLFGPKGSVATGDAGQASKSIENMYSSGTNLYGKLAGEPKQEEATTQSKLGLTPEQFSQLSPELKQSLLRKVMGR